jgi:hypothetical protein
MGGPSFGFAPARPFDFAIWLEMMWDLGHEASMSIVVLAGWNSCFFIDGFCFICQCTQQCHEYQLKVPFLFSRLNCARQTEFLTPFYVLGTPAVSVYLQPWKQPSLSFVLPPPAQPIPLSYLLIKVGALLPAQPLVPGLT